MLKGGIAKSDVVKTCYQEMPFGNFWKNGKMKDPLVKPQGVNQTKLISWQYVLRGQERQGWNADKIV